MMDYVTLFTTDYVKLIYGSIIIWQLGDGFLFNMHIILSIHPVAKVDDLSDLVNIMYL